MPYAVGPTGHTVHYRVIGEKGPCVVLVQGLGLSGRFWFEQPSLLADDREHPFRVLVVDNRGTGLSDAPRGPYKMSDFADDVVAAMDAAGFETASVVGISMGGMIAQHVALRHPKRVDGLVLLVTTPGLPHGRLPRPRHLAKLLSMPLLARFRPFALAEVLLPESEWPRARELMEDWPDAMAVDIVKPHAFFAQFAAVLGHSTGFKLGTIACPVVVVGAKHDVLVPPKNSEIMARRIPNAAFELLDAGHGVPITDRDVVRRCLLRLRAMGAKLETKRETKRAA